MMMTTANKRMQQRRGTSEVWAALDPVLLAGEIGVETDTGKMKVGDGAKRWSELKTTTIDTSSGGASGGGRRFVHRFLTQNDIDLTLPLDLRDNERQSPVFKYTFSLGTAVVYVTAKGGGAGSMPKSGTNYYYGRDGGVMLHKPIPVVAGDEMLIYLGAGGSYSSTASIAQGADTIVLLNGVVRLRAFGGVSSSITAPANTSGLVYDDTGSATLSFNTATTGLVIRDANFSMVSVGRGGASSASEGSPAGGYGCAILEFEEPIV